MASFLLFFWTLIPWRWRVLADRSLRFLCLFLLHSCGWAWSWADTGFLWLPVPFVCGVAASSETNSNWRNFSADPVSCKDLVCIREHDTITAQVLIMRCNLVDHVVRELLRSIGGQRLLSVVVLEVRTHVGATRLAVEPTEFRLNYYVHTISFLYSFDLCWSHPRVRVLPLQLGQISLVWNRIK